MHFTQNAPLYRVYKGIFFNSVTNLCKALRIINLHGHRVFSHSVTAKQKPLFLSHI